MTINERIVNSSLWAAYGDALGYITELADEKSIKKRIPSSRVYGLTEWKRFIGGINGINTLLPSGTYSDDTQLRLSTSRCINASGYFDVDSFSKIELPVWLSYALGAGYGSKAAAKNLTKSSVSWFSNFYEDKKTNYFKSGGNGAMMRIQPHVWSTLQTKKSGMLLDVIRNTICTHGHIRAIAGSCLHALILRWSFKHSMIPDINTCLDLSRSLITIDSIFLDDVEISSIWLPYWEEKTGLSFKESMAKVIKEIIDDFKLLQSIPEEEKPQLKYYEALKILGGFDPSQRGSGTKTAILSWYLSDLFKDSPHNAMISAANAFESDTDTIATAAGAILGSVCNIAPPERVLDQAYITSEARRISLINNSQNVNEFTFPAIQNWTPPRNQLDSLITSDKDSAPYIMGLGKVIYQSSEQLIGRNNSLRWNWVKTHFGQTMLIRSRAIPKQSSTPSISGYVERINSSSNTIKNSGQEQQINSQKSIFDLPSIKRGRDIKTPTEQNKDVSIDKIIEEINEKNFTPESIGTAFLDLVSRNNKIEDIIIFSSLLTSELRKLK